jgi:hypothetical protein
MISQHTLALLTVEHFPAAAGAFSLSRTHVSVNLAGLFALLCVCVCYLPARDQNN